MEKNRCDWTYFFDNDAILGRAKRIVVAEGLSSVEVVIAQTVSGFLGEIESVSSNRENGKKAYHILIVLTLRDTSSLQYFGFSPSRTSFFILAAS